MGFRSTFCTSDDNIQWPTWFRDKYQEMVHVPDKGSLTSKHECKTYFTWLELPQDIQKAIDWSKQGSERHPFVFMLVYLHECGGITRCAIMQDKIVWTEPLENQWDITEGMSHSYCYCKGPFEETTDGR